MSRILKRPMFRIGGSANNGIMSMAAPRRNYEEGSPKEQRVTKSAEEYARIFEKFAGTGPSVQSDLGDMLISGGLNLLSGKGAGKGTLGALATSYSDPYQTFSKARSAEDALKRQLRVSAATQAISSDEAKEAAAAKMAAELAQARAKAKEEGIYLKQEPPERVFQNYLLAYTDPKNANPYNRSITTDYPESMATYAAYILPNAKKIGITISGAVPSQIKEGQREFFYDQMVAGQNYFDPRTNNLVKRNPETNIVTEINPYTGEKIGELQLSIPSKIKK